MSLEIARGSVEYKNGDKWEGGFVDGQPGGYGTHTFANGNVYEGGWEDGEPYGFGKMTYADGKYEYYEGEWASGKRHGNGTVKWSAGELYVGHFQNGKFHGNGTLTFRSGGQYKGEFANGRGDGIGTYTYPNGNEHEGEWLNNKKHGNGTFKHSSGSVYEGEWLNDKRHGSGVLTKASGEQLKQEYKHGQLLSSKRVATLTNGPPSQRPHADGNSVNDMFMLNEDYTTCDICMERFSFDRNTADEEAKKRLPVLSKTCDHWFCHGCILGEQGRRAGLAEDGASPSWIACMKCRSDDAFCPSEPRYDRRLIDMLSSSIPVREERSAVVERDD